MTELSIDQLVFDEKGLIPAIVQDVNTKEVLTLAYMNKQSLQKTLETGETWFYSRSRQTMAQRRNERKYPKSSENEMGLRPGCCARSGRTERSCMP